MKPAATIRSWPARSAVPIPPSLALPLSNHFERLLPNIANDNKLVMRYDGNAISRFAQSRKRTS